MPNKLTKEEFVKSVTSRLTRPLDLSRFDYLGNAVKGLAVCPEHGEFKVTPCALMGGVGCAKCALESRSRKRSLSLSEWINKAKAIHGDKFDYSRVVYTNSQTSVSIVCPLHGEFRQRAGSHLTGRGCPNCRYGVPVNKLSNEEAIARIREVHGDLYDLSLVSYEGQGKSILLKCSEHGVFKALAGNVIGLRSGCPACAKLKQGDRCRKPDSHYIERALESHGNRYTYLEVFRKAGAVWLKVCCPEHGVFDQLAQDHFRGCGCSTCASGGFKSAQPAYLYIYRVEGTSGSYLGFGVTNNFKQRDSLHKRNLLRVGYTRTVEHLIRFDTGREALAIETEIKRLIVPTDLGVKGFKAEACSLDYWDGIIRLIKKAP